MRKSLCLPLYLVAIFTSYGLVGCDSGEEKLPTQTEQTKAILTAENALYFYNHVLVTIGSGFSGQVFDQASELLSTHFHNGGGEISINCQTSGLVTGNPSVNSVSIGHIDLRFEACTFPFSLGSISGEAILKISKYAPEQSEFLKWDIIGGTLSFENLEVESNGRSAIVDGKVDRVLTNSANNSYEEGGISVHIPFTETYELSGLNQGFSRNFRLSIKSGLPAFYPTYYEGRVYDDGEYVELVLSDYTEEIYNQQDGNIIALQRFYEFQGAGRSKVRFSDWETGKTYIGVPSSNPPRIDIDQDGDGIFENSIIIPQI